MPRPKTRTVEPVVPVDSKVKVVDKVLPKAVEPDSDKLIKNSKVSYQTIARDVIELGFDVSKDINFPLMLSGNKVSIAVAIIQLALNHKDSAMKLVDDLTKLGGKHVGRQLIYAMRADTQEV